jgi:hypothetical protein
MRRLRENYPFCHSGGIVAEKGVKHGVFACDLPISGVK